DSLETSSSVSGIAPRGTAALVLLAIATLPSSRYGAGGPIVPSPWDIVRESTARGTSPPLPAEGHLSYDSVVALTAGGSHLRAHPGHRPRRCTAGVERAPRSEHRRTRRRQWLLPRVTSAPRARASARACPTRTAGTRVAGTRTSSPSAL